MARKREFDQEAVLERATRLFWEKGYAATSTEELLAAMEIGRQSLYNAFGDKHGLYLEVLKRYGQQSLSGHLENLRRPKSAAEGLEALLLGLVSAAPEQVRLGCLGVNATCEFGTSNPDLEELKARGSQLLRAPIRERILAGQADGELDQRMDAGEAADFVLMSMQGIQLGARAGADPKVLQDMARFAVSRLR